MVFFNTNKLLEQVFTHYDISTKHLKDLYKVKIHSYPGQPEAKWISIYSGFFIIFTKKIYTKKTKMVDGGDCNQW